MNRDEDPAGRTLLAALLGDAAELPAEDSREWDILLHRASTEGVLLRLLDVLTARRMPIPSTIGEAALRQRRRFSCVMTVVEGVSRACDVQQMQFLFPKVLRSYPDVGRDIDLVLLGRSPNIDSKLIASFAVTETSGGLRSRLTGAWSYAISGCPTRLDVHHGRLGWSGEEILYPKILMANRHAAVIHGIEVVTASPEDQLVLDALQRPYGRRRPGLSQILAAVSGMRRPGLDWDYIVRTCRLIGIHRGLSCFVAFVDHVHLEVTGCPLIDGAVRHELRIDDWSGLWKSGQALGNLGVTASLYTYRFGHRLTRGDWGGAMRIALAPVIAAVAASQRAERQRSASRSLSESGSSAATRVPRLEWSS